jgi:hypothetical protein
VVLVPNSLFSQNTEADTFSEPSENSKNSAGTRENTCPASPLDKLPIEKLFCTEDDAAVVDFAVIFRDVPKIVAVKSLENKGSPVSRDIREDSVMV